MKIKTIVVALMTDEDAKWLVPAACAVANACGAHLIGVHPVEANIPYASAGGMIMPLESPIFYDWQNEETAAIKATFERLTRVEDFVAEWRAQETGTLGASDFLTSIARSADMVMIGQPDPNQNRRDQSRIYEHVIRQSGRPVLMIPQGYVVDGIGRHILIGWSDTREAARAAHDALSLVHAEAQVDVLHVGPDAQDDQRNASGRYDLAAAFDRQGIKVELTTSTADAKGIAATLVRQAFERGCDMIVTGAFGHSRTYDFVIGAITHDVMKRAKVPVLFSR